MTFYCPDCQAPMDRHTGCSCQSQPPEPEPRQKWPDLVVYLAASLMFVGFVGWMFESL